MNTYFIPHRHNMLLRAFFLHIVILCFLSPMLHAVGNTEADTAMDGKSSITLRFSTYHSYRNPAVNTFITKLKQGSENHIDIDVFYGATLLKKAELLHGISEGIVDIGAINPIFYPQILSLHAIMPAFSHVPVSMQEKIKAMEKIYAQYPEFLREIEKFQQHVLFQLFPQPMAIISSVPVKSIEDIQGLRIRASSRVFIRILRSLGANPVSLPLEDCYIALQTGTIDGMFTTIDTIHSLRLHELASYSFTSPQIAFIIPHSYTIRSNTWDQLNEDFKNAAKQASFEASDRAAQTYESSFYEYIQEQEKNGVEVTIADEEDLAQWHALPVFENLRNEFAKEAESKGVKDGEQMVEDIKSILSVE